MSAEAAKTCRPRGETTATVNIRIAPGEVLDRLTILEIKAERINDTAKLANVRREHAELAAAAHRAIPATAEIAKLRAELKAVNAELWEIEDDIRDCERARDFGPRFIALARAVYTTNDRRAALKRRINEALGSDLVEEKSYAPY